MNFEFDASLKVPSHAYLALVQSRSTALGWLVPIMIDIMMDNPDRDWGKPFYPVVD
jgi:hypothetical protein